jgi:ABC-type dipeptide/oligopeptide/nickel transport system permease component
MNLNKTQKILLGIFTIVPFILSGYIFYQIFHFILSTVEASQGQDYEPSESAVIAGVLSFIVPIIVLTFISLFLHVFYIVHAALNKQLDQTEKILWILLFIFFGTIPFIIYWFIRLWNENQRPLTQGL